jgi:hypothetical protein
VGSNLQITERDRELLEFMAAHRLVRADHVRTFLGVSARVADARLRALRKAGLVVRDVVFSRTPATHRITRDGLAAIGSSLPVPKRDLRTYSHDLGVAWLWLAARDGAFGELRQVIPERELRSRDGVGRRSDPPLAVNVGGFGPAGQERLHYPDLLLVTPEGHRIAVELELSAKGRGRRERILEGYACDGNTDVVLYLVKDWRIGAQVQASARRLGIAPMVHVQRVRMADPTLPTGRERTAQRSRNRGGGRASGAPSAGREAAL